MADTLGRLLTDLGERSLYDAVSQCSRCGYCEQACPTYVATGREAYSPRGRNQLLRQLLEGKIAGDAAVADALSTCLLCGACQTACYAHVPVPDLVLEGRRLLRGRAHWLVRRVSRLLVERPQALALLLKLGFALKRAGLSRLGRPLLRVAGLGPLAAMDEHSGEAPLRNLDDMTRGRPQPAAPAWQYFASCGPRYLLPRVGLATLTALGTLQGPGAYLGNPCCGLLAHNYGELEHARALARKNIEHAEKNGEQPIIGDCSSCVAFLKSYPQLFLGAEEADWRVRAERFVKRVQDALEAYGSAAKTLRPGPQGPAVTYHDSCRALNGQGLREQPRATAKAAAGGSYRELPSADDCCGGAGAFGFMHERLSEELLVKKIGNIAAAQAGVVLSSSTSCLLQLARGLRKYYPEAKALHLSEYVAGALEKPHGA